MTTQITGNNITAGSITTTQLVTTIVNTLNTAANVTSVLVSNVAVSDSSWNVLDDTAVDTAGGYIVVTGSGFATGAIVIAGTNNATSTSFVSSTTLRAQLPAQPAGTYPLYVVNTDGSTAIRVNGITYSAFPAWSTGSTLANVQTATSFGVNLSATSDSTITYANTTPIPYGTTLAANGFFYGTVTIGSATTYSFTVDATDTQNQNTTRSFSMTVTLTPLTRLYSWGMGGFGVGGLNQGGSYVLSPTQVGTGTNWRLVSGRATNTAAIKNDGTLWVWGYNNGGQLGTNDATYAKSSPTQVGALTTWNLVSVGSYSIMATKTDGTLWAWGDGTQGQLGQNNTTKRSSPTQIGTGTDWNRIETASSFSMATKTDGTLWAWGQGYMGKLGLGDLVDRSSPVQVGVGTTWNRISVSTSQCLATKTDGTLWGWGKNGYGSLGFNDASYRTLIPTQIGASTDWNLVAGGEYSSMATKTNGTLWTWGRNHQGQLGFNNRVDRSSPTQVGTDTNWNLISASPNTSHNRLATKTDGTMWSWGDNGNGQLGKNDQTNRSSPVQIGASTTWSFISAGRGVFAITSIAP